MGTQQRRCWGNGYYYEGPSTDQEASDQETSSSGAGSVLAFRQGGELTCQIRTIDEIRRSRTSLDL